MDVEVETKIARYGNSLTVRLPVGVARELDLRDGDRVMLRKHADGVLIARSQRSRLEWRLSSVSSAADFETEEMSGTVGAEDFE